MSEWSARNEVRDVFWGTEMRVWKRLGCGDCRPVIPAFGGPKLEYQGFEVSLGYITIWG